ncbi:hypothetical protein Tco_0374937 [Tanacetum coccineum]
MDSMIPIGQKNTLAEYMILSGVDNRPPVLDKDLTKKYAELSQRKFKLVMISRQQISFFKERECKLYDSFDKFAHIKRESLHQYYLRFTQLINDINIYKMILEQFQVNTKFFNSLLPEWSKFVTDVKLVKDFHTTNFDQLHAYLQQHELHANEVRIMHEHNHDPLALVSNHQETPSHSTLINLHTTIHNSNNSFHHLSLLNMDLFIRHKITQLLIHPHRLQFFNQQTHQAKFPQIDSGLTVLVFKQGDDPINAINKMMSFLMTVQLVQGTQNSFAAGTSGTRANVSGTGGNNSGQQRIMKCFNCQREAQENGKVLNEEELEFLADPGIAKAKAVLMANLSSYGSDVLSEAPHSENTHTDMLNQSVKQMSCSEQTHLVNYPENEITSDSNIIPYSRCLLETQNVVVQDTISSTQQDTMILSVFEQLSNQVTNCNKVNEDNLIANESLSDELERYKERVKLLEERQNVDEKELLTKTFNVFKNESKEMEVKNIDTEIALEKKVKEPDNIIRPMLYDGSVITKETNVISIADSEETLMLQEESRSKMLLKQSDPMVLENKVNTKLINYARLNRLSEDFSKRFIPQQEQVDEQAFWLQTSHPNTDQSASSLVKIEDPRELPKIRLVITSLKKLKYHLGQFDNVVKNQITPDVLT